MPRDPSDHGRCSRRAVLAAALLSAPALARAAERPRNGPLAMPGPFRGRVVEVWHPGAVVEARIVRERVREMLARGICSLTGETHETDAWKRFFGPGDVVGVKVCPVGKPKAISQPETVLEVLRGLKLAGVPNRSIILFDRYEKDLQACGFDRIAPAGVRCLAASQEYDDVQTALDGYDPDKYVDMPRVMTGQDPAVPVNRRSHLCTIVSKHVTKVVNVAVLKDHASAGVTMTLKNMSHGFVNNVCRSHADHEHNWCDAFIPAVVGMRSIREKVVLHIADALIAAYDGGPGSWNRHFRTWDCGALFVGTDPVAMDRVGWSILDAKRKSEGLPAIEQTGMKLKNPGHETFDRRQPEYVLIAGTAGLGESDLAKIDHRRIRLP